MYKTQTELREDKLLQESLLNALVENVGFKEALKSVIKLEPKDKPDAG